MQPIMTVETITPDVAAMMLKQNTGNRALSRATVERYSAAIRRGDWSLNGESIKFSKDGRLLDGQHRLAAVVACKVAIQSAVVRGLDEGAFVTLDSGKRRAVGDVLSCAGEVSANNLAGALAAIKKLHTGVTSSTAMTASEAQELLTMYPEVRYWVGRFASSKAFRALFPSAICGALVMASRKYGFDVAESFFEKLHTGVGLTANDPAHLLREKFIARKHGMQFTTEMKLAYIVRALSAHCNGREMKLLRVSDGDDFPKL